MPMASLINRIGAFNPQMLREFRGRLKPRSVMAAVGLSLLFQLLVLLSAQDSRVAGPLQIDLTEVVTTLSWTPPYVLFALGGYYIVDDLTQEARTGTLNFIRLSPRPVREILLGKLLGVPILPMLFVLALVPLHVFSALATGLSPLLLLSYYLVVGFGAVTVFILALLVGLGSGVSKLAQQRGVSAIAFAGLMLIALTPIFMVWNTQFTWQTVPTGENLFRAWEGPLEWLYLDIAYNPWFSHLFVLGNLVAVAAIAWKISVRKFRVPHSTLISKRISYIGVAYANFVGWGFAWSTEIGSYDQVTMMWGLYFLNVALFFVLIFALAPTRQMLLDWVRYRSSGQYGARRAQDKRVREWIWANGSPSVGAIAINYVIAAALIVPSLYWFASQPPQYEFSDTTTSLGALLFATASIFVSVLTYATLVQVIFSRRLRAPIIWAAGSVAVLAIVPPLVLLFSSMYPDMDNVGPIWTFVGLPLLGDARTQVPFLSLVGFVGQLCFLGFLFNRLNQNLRSLAIQQPVVEEAAFSDRVK